MNNLQGSQDQEYDICQSLNCKYIPSTENECVQNHDLYTHQSILQSNSSIDKQFKQEKTVVQSSIYSGEQQSNFEQSEFHQKRDYSSNVHEIQCVSVQKGVVRKKKQKEAIIDDIQDSESEQHYDFNDQFNERDRINNTLGNQITSEGSDDNNQSEGSLLQLNSSRRRESQSNTSLGEPQNELNEDNEWDIQYNLIVSDSGSDIYGSSEEEDEVEKNDFVSDDSQCSDVSLRKVLKKQKKFLNPNQYHKITEYFPFYCVNPLFYCSICLDLQALKTITYSCGHKFHVVCIKPWIFRKKYTCPICRKILERTNLKI